MKKKLVVLLAVVMMFAFSASAYAVTFSDVSDRPIVEQDAIKKAVALGIINGYEDGTFGPEKTITRAEFAKIAVTAAGAKQTATMLEGNASSFNDVRANQWYTGWINAAQSLGIMQGDGGNFRPNDNISNQEAITVMLRLLGYNDNLTGNWPANYVTKANQLDLLDDVEIVAAAAAKRGDIVVILGEVLDTDIVTYDKDTNEFVKKQVLIRGSEYITLLQDSFDGSFVKVDGKYSFSAITQVRDASAKTLNWNIDYNTIDKDGNDAKGSATFIIDDQSAVSYNANGLFDLEGHQGKIYFVESGGRKYVRFIEVESYVQAVTDNVKIENDRFTVLKKTYGTVKDPVDYKGNSVKAETKAWSVQASNPDSNGTSYAAIANSYIYLYTNDDDQVYKIVVDKDFAAYNAYMVKSVNTNNVRLIGNSTQTVSMNDADTLIWDGDKFIAPSDLEVGDAVVEITKGELYVLTNTITGELQSTDRSDKRYKVAGKNYVSGTGNVLKFLDEEFEDTGIAPEDVVGNNVTILLNKDNSIAAMMVDETSTGTTLYGIITSGGNASGDWVTGNLDSVTIFTQEGYTVTYDFDEDFTADVNGTGTGAKNGISAGLNAETLLGALVAYKLDKNGEINDLKVVGHSGAVAITSKNAGSDLDLDDKGVTMVDGVTAEVKIKNNAYITADGETPVALAANAIIFEVGEKANGSGYNKVDVNLVTRSAMLSKGDFEPEQIVVGRYNADNASKTANQVSTLQYLVYTTNTAGAIKAMAFTTTSSDELNYAVIAAYNFRSTDYDKSITLKGDDNVYELKAGKISGNTVGGPGQLLIYTLSGNKVETEYAYKKQASGLASWEVAGVNSGLITFENNGVIVERTYDNNENTTSFVGTKTPTTTEYAKFATNVYRNDIMTDTNTLVYVIDATDGTFSEGSLSDIGRGDWAYVPVIDKDGYADIVIVDEYTKRNN